jgi:predicted  nucleic acid-binding Zn-ribbon protein
MHERLKALYELQLEDDKLDELESVRGDLPALVRELEVKIKHQKDTIDSRKSEIEECTNKRDMNFKEMEKFLDNQKKYKSQLFNVRNNKEYDALTKSIDQSEDEIKKRELESEALGGRIQTAQEEIDALLPALEEDQKELKEKESELKQIIKANEREETKIRDARAKIESRVKKADLSHYMLIRKAKNGKAVVTIDRSACTGCQNILTSQRQLDIRKKEKIYTCDNCGRIIIPKEIAEETL